MIFAGCGKMLNKRVTLWRNDKIPYGTWYAYNQLGHIFTDAEISPWNRSPLGFYSLRENSSAYLIVGNTFRPNDEELRAIMSYAVAGNHVFISARHIGQNVLDSFNLKYLSGDAVVFKPDSLTVSVYDPESYDSFSFTYPGRSLDSYFTSMDSTYATILGMDRNGNANFVKFTYQQGGAVYLHLAPLAFSNFFLLHRDNKEYYDLAMSSIPDSVDRVRWDDYFRHHANGRDNTSKSAFSKLGAFLENEILRWAFWLTLLLFAIVYLFESKRKQRVVPAVKKVTNTTLDFVRTVGRLYYQRKDNANLAAKITAHFLGHVRTKYNLPTSSMSGEFEKRLAFKSGCPETLVKEIVQYIRALESKGNIGDGELLDFNAKIESFYKHTHTWKKTYSNSERT